MKALPILFCLGCTVPLATAVPADYECVGRASPALPATAYRFRESIDWDLSTLRKHFSDRGKLATVSAVLDSANHELFRHLNPAAWAQASRTSVTPLEVYRWPDASEGFNDFGTTKWYPQGITSSFDALQTGIYEGREVWLVSWYDDTEGEESVRITFIDQETLAYRHVLLVVPNTPELFTGPPVPATDFKRLGIHAGGIVWYGATLWVVDTSRGIRVFDLNNIWQVETGAGVGKMSNGEFSAQDYRYVIPQIRSYLWYPNTSGKTFQHSFVSLDREGTDKLLIGEYVSAAPEDANEPIRLVNYNLDYTTRKLRTSLGVASATWAYCVNITAMQGAVSHGQDNFYLSTSNGESGHGDLWTWKPGSYAREFPGFMPPGPEDLTWENSTQTFTTVTEYPGNRWILKYRSSQAPVPS